MNWSEAPPQLSVVLVCYEMAAQVEQTLRSLLPPYQRDIRANDYEIIVVDNGSRQEMEPRVRALGPNVHYHYIPPAEAHPSPARALNCGVRRARAPFVCLMIDGARLVTPGVLSWALRLLQLAPRAAVEVRGWHLGPKFQPDSVLEGYNRTAEKELLARIGWPENGYRLWEIAAATPQTHRGYSGRTAESNCLFMARALFEQLGGLDERTSSAGGGWVNLDFFTRTVQAAEGVFTLLGEGTFHQVHGGAATGLSKPQLAEASKGWRAESEALGQKILPKYEYILAGHLPPECAAWLAQHPPNE